MGQTGHTLGHGKDAKTYVTHSQYLNAESVQKQVACQIAATWQPYVVKLGVGPLVALLVSGPPGQAEPVTMVSGMLPHAGRGAGGTAAFRPRNAAEETASTTSCTWAR